jgi:hypothetical protein
MDARSSSPPGPWMLELSDGSEVRRIAVRQMPFAIGRSKGCDLVLPFGYISRVSGTGRMLYCATEEAGTVPL